MVLCMCIIIMCVCEWRGWSLECERRGLSLEYEWRGLSWECEWRGLSLEYEWRGWRLESEQRGQPLFDLLPRLTVPSLCYIGYHKASQLLFFSITQVQ